MSNYFLVPMNFLQCNFERMRNEWKENKKIMWQVPGKTENKNGEWKIKSSASMPKMIKTGDIIYFYVCKIPSNGGKDKSRVLLRGVVDEEPTVVEYKEVYLSNEEKKTPIIGFSIKELTTLGTDELENDLCYSKEMLKQKYDFSASPQGKFWPNSCNGNLDNNLIIDLENSFKKSGIDRDFETLIKHFNRKCFFEEKIGVKGDHKTFKRRNGTDYYEIHHFIQRHSKGKDDGLIPIIEEQRNQICLCSNCHNKLHYGKENEIKKMIGLLWEDKEIHKMLKEKNFMSIIGADNERETLEWIGKIYKV